MGADGWIIEPSKVFECEVTCHTCGRTVYFAERPDEIHGECVGKDGRLVVNVEIENYEPR